ncbi:glycosyltransferase family 32 protein [Stipitochalara longipes BDJ]|nr:glycosyltransferase family 32 protein [Stipitochalara longipes BDJ]
MGGCLPKQIQRALPIYVVAILFVLYLSYGPSVPKSSFEVVHPIKRAMKTQQSVMKKLYPPSGGTKFPKKIWQTWRINPLDFEERDLTCARTWTQKNPGHRYEVLTDDNDMYFIETHFGPDGLNRGDIVEVYRSLTAKIIKADLLRYMIIYIEGGLYADIDVMDLRPIDRFIPERYNEEDIDMVIGVEIDQPDFADHPILGPKSMSFCQWTFMCKPRLPVIMRLIDNIMMWLQELSEKQGVPISELKLDFDEVILGTGPSAFTNAVLAEMSIEEGREVTWDTFHNIPESKVVGGILVLTVEAFAAGQGHSDSGNHNARTALVKHRYHASKWPTHHPRYKHPVYGEVEKCNWKTECVKMWDYNTALFEGLSEDEKQKLITEKQQRDQEKQAEDDRMAKQLEEYIAAEKEAKKKGEAVAPNPNPQLEAYIAVQEAAKKQAPLPVLNSAQQLEAFVAAEQAARREAWVKANAADAAQEGGALPAVQPSSP